MPVREQLFTTLRRGWLAGLTLRELGLRQVAWYGLYRLGVGSGHYRRVLPDPVADDPAGPAYRFRPLLQLPAPKELAEILGDAGQRALLAEADEIAAGQVRLFSGAPQPLKLALPGPLRHWTAYEHGVPFELPEGDIKFLWEPARFGWAFTLGRAYRLSGDERYPAAFWQQAEIFLQANPPYNGPHWSSAQEVALRLMAFVFASQVFAGSPHSTPGRQARLAQSIAQHAARILPTLPYARAQNNNHLLSEAAGLYTAGLALPDHPQAGRWRESGWEIFQRGLLDQVAADGSYSQHSTNYHRLMLQLVLWVATLSRGEGRVWPPESWNRLVAAAHWLLALLDPSSGRVPNLGPNDGAYIFPFTVLPFGDYRPVLQAVVWVLEGEPVFEPGAWDEMGLWFGLKRRIEVEGQESFQDTRRPPSTASGAKPAPLSAQDASWRTDACGMGSPHILRSPDGNSWAYLRAAHFSGRPGHADQLHLDLWWRGINVAQDAGTYLYNAAPPWDNALRLAEVHNTVTLFGEDQMLSAGRFLYVRRAQARLESYRPCVSLVASHNGYTRMGITHTRAVEVTAANQWGIEDRIEPTSPGSEPQVDVQATLHWLLPDWPWEVLPGDGGCTILLGSPQGQVRVGLATTLTPYPLPLKGGGGEAHLQIARAGECLYGEGAVRPTWGWSSPTYGDKIPALSIRLSVSGFLPLLFITSWTFPESQS